ncbi:Dicer-like protein 2 [Coniothyrium glycines]
MTTSVSEGEPFRLRSYQAEMVSESMIANIIVVMDTGSGKTHIAIERARAELEICPANKLVWFLAPTVTLCEQQYEAFNTNLPGYGIQSMSGKDGVEHWTEQKTWDAVLHNVRIVISTHQVLLDALSHAFVRMNKLALLIFDEAHHCTSNHPARRIMSDFYTPLAANYPGMVPKVLGLTASPVKTARATSHDLEQIEQNLHATARTPKRHRPELSQYVHQPSLVQIEYDISPCSYLECHILRSLRYIYAGYNLESDPYVLDLIKKHHNGYDTADALQKVLISGKTYCKEQLRALTTKSNDMEQELGSSAAEWYLHQCIAKFEKIAQTSDQELLDWSVDEKRHLLKILKQLPLEAPYPSSISLEGLSQKVQSLIDLLTQQITNCIGFTGLVFVEQRAWIAVLAEILVHHPRTREIFRIGTFVGTSQSSQRKTSIAAFPEPRNQQKTLEDFRAGSLNLILATSVLEEGIDVSSCNVVICFEPPKNLKSFVQRRGRARKQASKYFIFTATGGKTRTVESWKSLEADMRAAYENDVREIRLASAREKEVEPGARFFRVPTTGALLTLDNASQHLHHFCAVVNSGPYVDSRPQFQFFNQSEGLRARVTMPLSVDPTLRHFHSAETWATERMARKDAAFEAYKGLHIAGLVNDNLLPMQQVDDGDTQNSHVPDHRPSMVDQPHAWHRTLITVQTNGEKPIVMVLFTPTALPVLFEFPLYWNQRTQYLVQTSWLPGTVLTQEDIETLRLITQRIFRSVFGTRMHDEKRDFMWLLAPCGTDGQLPDASFLTRWMSLTGGSRNMSDQIDFMKSTGLNCGLIRKQGDMRKYMLSAMNPNEPLLAASTGDRSSVRAIRVPKRRDFLHKVTGSSVGNHAYSKAELLPISDCVADSLPAEYSIFALFFPSILHRIEVVMIAEELSTTILQSLMFQSSHTPIITRALTSSSTDEVEDYQRLEFLGDCILKYVASVHLLAAYPKWPESYLTAKKGKIVSNGFLARASLAAELDRFIITKRFTAAKWKPRYVDEDDVDVLIDTTQQRSSKLIADVVESLIGASYMVGGIEKAFACICLLLPEERWTPTPEARRMLNSAISDSDIVMNVTTLEALVGRTFDKKVLLLESLTHSSYLGPNARCSYERLEFLGDAILDYIITERLHREKPELHHKTMHAVRTAMVNASFLAFQMFETTVLEEMTDVSSMRSIVHKRALWQFIRCGSPQVMESSTAAMEQHQLVRKQVISALAGDFRFPWHLLALTDAPKFLSDIVESVIGAIFIDTGDVTACRDFIHRLGILDCLERILRDNVDCLHPKERLGHLAIERNVRYVRVGDESEGSTGSSKSYRCQVKVGGEDVGGVVEGGKRLSAETLAAWHAISILEKTDDVVIHDGEEVFYDAETGNDAMECEW